MKTYQGDEHWRPDHNVYEFDQHGSAHVRSVSVVSQNVCAPCNGGNSPMYLNAQMLILKKKELSVKLLALLSLMRIVIERLRGDSDEEAESNISHNKPFKSRAVGSDNGN